ncbi:hypothetical protein QVD17_03160 [Tagetes erecta]|uniref:Uncharacterized protein n=1 Tax=Tagetes erecta TaxID=13708 RepID=A0AAD8L7W2_TARER|nr:hypothetical protein QVD17_03160 [Tagetes erecta]
MSKISCSLDFLEVLGNKYQSKLLEAIDSSQLPDFLGGTCSCPNEGGCLRSDKGPWHDAELMKLVNNEDRRKSPSFYDDDVDFEVKSIVSETTNSKLSEELLSNSGFPKSMSLSSSRDLINKSESSGIGVEPVVCSSQIDSLPTTDDTIRRTTKKVVDFMYKAVSCIFFLLAFGKFLVRNIIKVYQNQQDQPQIADDGHHQKDDILLPFVEKLKHLEALVIELSSKPSRLPEEKDVILAESLNRIRSMEFDLQKTKKALFDTASKQMELEESLEMLREGSITATKSCWVMRPKSTLRGTR